MALLTHISAGWFIRPCVRSDQAAMEGLFLDCLDDFPWRVGPVDELVRLRQTLRVSRCLVAQEASAGLVGFLTLEREKPYVAHLFVDRDWRLCGVGAGLLEVARNLARAPLELDVDVQNEGARRAYEAMGWVEKVGASSSRPGQTRMSGP